MNQQQSNEFGQSCSQIQKTAQICSQTSKTLNSSGLKKLSQNINQEYYNEAMFQLQNEDTIKNINTSENSPKQENSYLETQSQQKLSKSEMTPAKINTNTQFFKTIDSRQISKSVKFKKSHKKQSKFNLIKNIDSNIENKNQSSFKNSPKYYSQKNKKQNNCLIDFSKKAETKIRVKKYAKSVDKVINNSSISDKNQLDLINNIPVEEKQNSKTGFRLTLKSNTINSAKKQQNKEICNNFESKLDEKSKSVLKNEITNKFNFLHKKIDFDKNLNDEKKGEKCFFFEKRSIINQIPKNQLDSKQTNTKRLTIDPINEIEKIRQAQFFIQNINLKENFKISREKPKEVEKRTEISTEKNIINSTKRKVDSFGNKIIKNLKNTFEKKLEEKKINIQKSEEQRISNVLDQIRKSHQPYNPSIIVE